MTEENTNEPMRSLDPRNFVGPKVVSTTPTYEKLTDGPVVAREIASDSKIVGVVWAGRDGTSANFVKYDGTGPLGSNTFVSVVKKLRASYELGLSSLDALDLLADEDTQLSGPRDFDSAADIPKLDKTPPNNMPGTTGPRFSPGRDL